MTELELRDKIKEFVVTIRADVIYDNKSVRCFENRIDDLMVLIKQACWLKGEGELPKNPYPKEIFTMDIEESGKFLRETIGDAMTTATSGALGRLVYSNCQDDYDEQGFKPCLEWDK